MFGYGADRNGNELLIAANIGSGRLCFTCEVDRNDLISSTSSIHDQERACARHYLAEEPLTELNVIGYLGPVPSDELGYSPVYEVGLYRLVVVKKGLGKRTPCPPLHWPNQFEEILPSTSIAKVISTAVIVRETFSYPFGRS